MKDHFTNSERAHLVVKVTPNARKSEFLGWGTDEEGRAIALVKLAAPALAGKANQELLRYEQNCCPAHSERLNSFAEMRVAAKRFRYLLI